MKTIRIFCVADVHRVYSGCFNVSSNGDKLFFDIEDEKGIVSHFIYPYANIIWVEITNDPEEV